MVQRSHIFRDDGSWLKSTFMISIGESFESYAEAVAWASTDEIFGSNGQAAVHPAVQELLKGDPTDLKSPTPIYFSKRKCRDTSLGGNDAINSYYQYCENDDVVHPILKTNFGDSGMGRVYSEAIDDNQQILYISCGIPEYNSVSGFYSTVIVPELANWMNSGSKFRPSKLARLGGVVAGTFILLPVIPLIYIYNTLNKLASVPITKYYDLRPEMPMYYRFVNTIMISLAVNMGLAKDGRVLSKNASDITGSKTSAGTSYQALYADAVSEGYDDGADVGLPDIFNAAGWDIYRIMLRRYEYESNFKLIGNPNISTDQALSDTSDKADNTSAPFSDAKIDVDGNTSGKNWWKNALDSFAAAGIAGLYDANLFVGLRIEKSTDTSESISNSTGTSPVANALNAKYESIQSLKHSTLNGNIVGGAAGAIVGEFVSSLKNFATGVSEVAGIGGMAGIVLGSGRVDIPEIWTDSSFSKNYTFSFALRSPYGDPISIFQSIYVPLSLILGMSLPRAVGTNAYTSPFLVRAYSKGMLGIPLGIIDSVTIRRGSDQHGWNSERLPTAVDVSLTIKDLSPAMYMGMTDSQGIWDTVSGENSSFQEYLMTLGGLGLNERIRWIYKVRRSAEILLHTVLANRLNPIALGMGATTSTRLGRLVSAVAPRTLLPDN